VSAALLHITKKRFDLLLSVYIREDALQKSAEPQSKEVGVLVFLSAFFQLAKKRFDLLLSV